MAERKYTEDYIDYYNRVEFIQPLAHGIYIKEIYTKANKNWLISYESNSAHHICPYTGQFITCERCMLDYDGLDWDEEGEVEWCLSYEQRISTKALVARANTCANAGLEVKVFEHN